MDVDNDVGRAPSPMITLAEGQQRTSPSPHEPFKGLTIQPVLQPTQRRGPGRPRKIQQPDIVLGGESSQGMDVDNDVARAPSGSPMVATEGCKRTSPSLYSIEGLTVTPALQPTQRRGPGRPRKVVQRNIELENDATRGPSGSPMIDTPRRPRGRPRKVPLPPDVTLNGAKMEIDDDAGRAPSESPMTVTPRPSVDRSTLRSEQTPQATHQPAGPSEARAMRNQGQGPAHCFSSSPYMPLCVHIHPTPYGPPNTNGTYSTASPFAMRVIPETRGYTISFTPQAARVEDVNGLGRAQQDSI